MTRQELLASIPLFESLTPEDLDSLTRRLEDAQYATGDTIIPVSCSQGVGEHFGTDDYTEVAVPGGHIGTFVGGKAQKILAPTLADWFKARSR